MKKFWYDVLDRSFDSVSVWGLAPTFPVGHLNLAQHSSDTALLSGHILLCTDAEASLLTARVGRDNHATSLRDLYTRACRLMQGTVEAGNRMADQVRAARRIDGQSFRAVEDKGDKVLSAWKEINAYRATLNPALPALLVGTVALGDVQSTLGNYRQLLAAVSDKQAFLSTKKTNLRALVYKIDKNNKRWYQAWLGQFAAGSPERAALSQIDTGTTPATPGKGVFLGAEQLPNLTVSLGYGAARATGFTLWHQGPGDPEFSTLAENITARTFEHTNAPLGVNRYKVTGHNPHGDGSPSLVLEIEVAQQAVA